MRLSKDLNKNIKKITTLLNNNKDVSKREFLWGKTKVCLFYLYSQVDYDLIDSSILRPIMQSKNNKKHNVDNLLNNVIMSVNAKKCDTFEHVTMAILKADAILLIDGESNAVDMIMSQFPKRSVTEPPTNEVLAGPREGFVESIKTNLGLIRKRLPTTALTFVDTEIGYYTKTQVTVAYLNDIADKKIVKKIIERIKAIKIDGIIDSHYLISFLEERKNSIFKQIGKTEKPDIAVAKMLEGRVVIMVDGSPIVLTLPYMFFEDIQNSDDYYQLSFKVSFIRFIRLLGLIMSAILPGFYVAVQLYHYRIIPLKFLVTLMNTTQGLPFTPFLEILFVIILFEILFEASLRMPKFLGMALSIVGTLILGDTAVKAGLISPPSVMIVAVTNISFYTVPEQTPQLTILRLIFTLEGGAFGVYGIIAGSLYLLFHLCDFNSYGTPYFAPYAPNIKHDLEDGLFKLEPYAMERRPKSLPSQKSRRLKKEDDEEA